jgi:hypothetical protein
LSFSGPVPAESIIYQTLPNARLANERLRCRPLELGNPRRKLEQSEFEALDELRHEYKSTASRQSRVGRDLILMYGPAVRSQEAFGDEEAMRKADVGGN